MATAAPIVFGPLPKVRGGGRKAAGIWPGHSAEAKQVRDYAEAHPDEPLDKLWGPVAPGLSTSQATRIAHAINNGHAADFKPEPGIGKYRAKTRAAEGPRRHDLFVRWEAEKNSAPARRRGKKTTAAPTPAFSSENVTPIPIRRA
jgi:hypothetical protein